MYEAYFRLQKRPFSATPDANCFYAPELIRKLLDDLVQHASSGQGISVLTGAAGTGKTLLCRRLALELAPRFTPIFLANANFSTRRELLQAIHFELGRRCSGLDEQELRLELISSLRGLALSGKPAVLVVDEAHLLKERLLEELRTLATFDEGEHPLVRVILVGQMALEMRLVDPALEALNQRIVCQATLEPLTRQESREYVEQRVRWADGDAGRLFETAALDVIAEVCNGLPRCLNQLCDHSLLLAFVQEAGCVTREIVEQALADLRQLPLHWNESAATAGPLGDAAEGDDFFVLDDWDVEPIDLEDLEMPPAVEPTAAFEIGGDELSDSNDAPRVQESPISWITDAAPDSTSTSETQESMPSAEGSLTGVRVFREEPVDDRYAALDILTPRVSRTFEETGILEGWRHSPASPGSDVQVHRAEPVHEPAHDTPAVRTEVPPTADATRLQDDIDDSIDGPVFPIAPMLVDDADVLDVHHIESIVTRLQDPEEELGNTVLDVCLELQNSLGEWWEPQQADASADYVTADFADGTLPLDASQYDVVEPDRSRETGGRIDPPASGSGRPGTSGRYVPQPNYNHVFSMLRRKLGRGSPR